MKKLVVIVLMGVLLFNWVGYRLCAAFLQGRAEAQLVADIDLARYQDDQLITIKVPVKALSYAENSPVFERVDGEIEYRGLQYRYVKHRIFNDTLELQCIYDQRRTELLNARDQYFNLVSDFAASGAPEKTKKNIPQIRVFKADYFSKRESWLPGTYPEITRVYRSHFAEKLADLARLPLHQPPKVV